MAWTTIVPVSTGELATAAVHNTQVLGNLNELRQGGFALSGQVLGAVMTPSSATQWAVLTGRIRHPLVGLGSGSALVFSPPELITSTVFETSVRFDQAVTGAASVAFDVNGLALNTGATANAYARATWRALSGLSGTNSDYALRQPVFNAVGGFNIKGSDAQIYVGIGNVANIEHGTALVFTAVHVGFKIEWAASGTATLKGTVANGSTETETASLTNVALNDILELIFVLNGTTHCDFYYRLNSGALQGPTTVTTNLPSSLPSGHPAAVINNRNVASTSQAVFSAMSYRR